MPCRVVAMPGGGNAIVCGPRQRAPRCKCGSRRGANLLCDWKVGEGRTCDAPLCSACTTSPAPDKDLCPEHAAQWRARSSKPLTPETGA